MKKLTGKLPWTKSCFVCGEHNPQGLHARSRIEDGVVILEYTTRESDVGYKHIVHGGLGMTLIDEVMTWAAIAAMGKVFVAAEISVRLCKPVRVGEKLVARAWVEKGSGRLCLVRAEVLDAEGRQAFTAEGKYVPMPEEQAHLCEKDFVCRPGCIHPGELLG